MSDSIEIPKCEGDAVVAWLQMVRAYHVILRRVQSALDDCGVTMQQLELLYALSQADDVTQQEIAGRLLMTKGNVTLLIDRLAERGMLERRADPRDRRANRIFITDTGRELLRVALPVQTAVANEMLASISAERQRALRESLEELVTVVGAG